MSTLLQYLCFFLIECFQVCLGITALFMTRKFDRFPEGPLPTQSVCSLTIIHVCRSSSITRSKEWQINTFFNIARLDPFEERCAFSMFIGNATRKSPRITRHILLPALNLTQGASDCVARHSVVSGRCKLRSRRLSMVCGRLSDVLSFSHAFYFDRDLEARPVSAQGSLQGWRLNFPKRAAENPSGCKRKRYPMKSCCVQPPSLRDVSSFPALPAWLHLICDLWRL